MASCILTVTWSGNHSSRSGRERLRDIRLCSKACSQEVERLGFAPWLTHTPGPDPRGRGGGSRPHTPHPLAVGLRARTLSPAFLSALGCGALNQDTAVFAPMRGLDCSWAASGVSPGLCAEAPDGRVGISKAPHPSAPRAPTCVLCGPKLPCVALCDPLKPRA